MNTQNYRYLVSNHNENLPTPPQFFIRTYGCQMNSRDSEKLAGLLTTLGYTQAESQDSANLILYNTCCVRESAEDKILGNLGRLKHRKKTEPDLIIGVTGCMSQQKHVAEKMKKTHKHVNLVFGTGNRHLLPQFLWQVISTGKQVVDITEADGDKAMPEIEDIPITTRDYPHKAGVNIMYGCNNFCSYCIVPYVRGREKSRATADIIKEITDLAQDGVKEIMLLGQNVNSYQYQGVNFPQLLELVHNIPGLARIRFMTSHPKDFSDQLIDTVATLPKVCNFIHLPIQSGSTKVLQDMNRGYTQADYLTLVTKLKAKIPGIALSTDIIVGYPGETEADFAETLKVVETANFANAFTFLYSKRSGTPAAERTDTIPPKVASERFDQLNDTLGPILFAHNQNKIGHSYPTIVEEITPKGYKGRTEDHTLVHFTTASASSPLQQGDIIDITITEAKTFYVTGIIATKAAIKKEKDA